MARAKSTGNGHLEQTTALLNQSIAALNQAMATFLARNAESDGRIAELERERNVLERESNERFARIEAILLEHSRILQALPDAIDTIGKIRDTIGFKSPE